MDTLSCCRACHSPDLFLFLPMGLHPPANMFVRAADLDAVEPAFALNAQACLACGLIQVADQIPKDFFRNYLYVPSGAATMHTHFAEAAGILVDGASGGLIVDIGCNDGLLLSACAAKGGRTLGIDPAANLAELARERGVEVWVDYFSPETAAAVRQSHGPAKIVVTTNTFNHIGDLHAFMAGVDALLDTDGTFVIEVPWSKDLIERNEFDTIYHEHVSEFSLLSIQRLAEPFGMAVVDVTRLTVHGGSVRVFLKRAETATPASPAVARMLEEEREAGILERATYEAFAARVADIRVRLKQMIIDLRASGKKVAGYGAPAKGNSLLNYFDLGPNELDFLVDRNPLKHDLFSPGMRIPIRSPEAIETERPDVLLVLAWNFYDEIRQQQEDFAARGGRFIVPLPAPVLVP